MQRDVTYRYEVSEIMLIYVKSYQKEIHLICNILSAIIKWNEFSIRV